MSYTNGDFEESVPVSAARLRNIPPKKKPSAPKPHGRKDKHTVKLSDAANAGDIGLVLQALGASRCTSPTGDVPVGAQPP